jgi:hypothetical protein
MHPRVPPGYWRQHAGIGKPTQRGKPQRWWDVLTNWRSVRIRPDRLGWREARSTGEAG